MHIVKLALPLDAMPVAGKAAVHKAFCAMPDIAAVAGPAQAAMDSGQAARLDRVAGRNPPATPEYPARHQASHRQENVHALTRINRRH